MTLGHFSTGQARFRLHDRRPNMFTSRDDGSGISQEVPGLPCADRSDDGRAGLRALRVDPYEGRR